MSLEYHMGISTFNHVQQQLKLTLVGHPGQGIIIVSEAIYPRKLNDAFQDASLLN
jgi:hypothetical protein